jgi:hypothetical protein
VELSAINVSSGKIINRTPDVSNDRGTDPLGVSPTKRGRLGYISRAALVPVKTKVSPIDYIISPVMTHVICHEPEGLGNHPQ